MVETVPCVPENTRITLLKGGLSGEREVSLVSGASCAKALREEGFPVVEVDTADEDAIQQIVDSRPDVVFIALHGKYGEDGCMQGLCELMHVPYTGPGVLASALAMDKTRTKVIYRSCGLPTPPSVTINKGDEFTIEGIVAEIGEKCLVKPAHEGSTVGISLVKSSADLGAAIEKAFESDSLVLIEKFIEGTELTVAVLGNREPEALPVIEIVPEISDFYDYEAKYAAGGSTHVIPARISDEATAKCQEYAVAAHKALGCMGVSRTDMFIEESGQIWLIETNTIPGMTPTSLLPDTASRVGIEFGPLCKMLVELAIEEQAG